MATSEFQGGIHYRGGRCFLQLADASTAELAIDRPPLGATDIGDFIAATTYFRDFLQIQEGGTVAVEGYATSFGSMRVIQVTRPL
jgi:hypothetical protein